MIFNSFNKFMALQEQDQVIGFMIYVLLYPMVFLELA
jgi:hypothetical protein